MLIDEMYAKLGERKKVPEKSEYIQNVTIKRFSRNAKNIDQLGCQVFIFTTTVISKMVKLKSSKP